MEAIYPLISSTVLRCAVSYYLVRGIVSFLSPDKVRPRPAPPRALA
jgi:hypothetical protein